MRILSIFFAMVLSLNAHAESVAKANAKARDAAIAFESFMARDTESIPLSLLKHADCVMVITNMFKAGFIIGARTGWGVTSCRTANGWSPVAFHQISGLNWGLQAGVEKLNVVLIFTRRDAVDALSSPKLNLGAGLSIAAGPVGRGLEAGTDFKLDSPVYSYTRGKGLYAGISLEGSVVDPLVGYNQAVYGRMSTRQILTDTKHMNISTSAPFLRVLRKYAY
jgi:lipid-binding SYLF domain-containing protein